MRYPLLFALLGVSLWAQSPPDCSNSVTRDVDVRCSCFKDPASEQCKLVRSGFYDPDHNKIKPINLNSGGTFPAPPARTALPRSQPIRPQQARVVPLAHKDYLRFLPPNARLAAGFDFGKVFRSPDLMSALFAQGEGSDALNQVMAALKEMDHLWLSYAPPSDVVVLMTGKFEQGAAVGMFYAQGIRPVFLNDAHAMMIGSEPSIQAALARLNKPAAPPRGDTAGWVTRRARELSKDHETWIVTESPSANPDGGPLQAIRQFALGVRITGQPGIDGEAIADSEASAEKIAAWVDQIKAALRQKTGVGVLDALTVERSGSTLHFSAKDDALLAGDAGKTAMNSDLGVELYDVIMAGFPGMPSRAVAGEKLLAVKTGMSRVDVLNLLGKPLSVSKIEGLDVPRETWTYQEAFGKQLSLRLDDGIVSILPH
jgi:hypothetical protein